MPDKVKAVVVLSGGLDSSTLFAYAIENGYDVRAVTYNYGQRHVREIDAAKAIVQFYSHKTGKQIPHDIIDMTQLKLASALTDKNIKMPHDAYDSDNQKITVVPNRNAIMLSMAVGIAASNGFNRVMFGAHSNDYAVYPDCRPEFVNAFEVMTRKSLDEPYFVVEAPFLKKSKADIVKVGLALNVPYGLTTTCYEGDFLACGQCGSCRERLDAFAKNGAQDPIAYKETSNV